jgi:hypothetical protein
VAQRLSTPDGTSPVTAEQVRALATEALTRRLPLGLAGYRYGDGDIFNVLVAAAAQRRSIASVSRQLVDAPSANLVRHYLTSHLFDELDLDELEATCNALLVERLPPGLLGRRLRVAIDLTLLPYYGRTTVEPDQLRRGEAQAGTTRFHCYATASVLRAGQRVTLALSFVYAEEALLDVLTDLLGRLARLGVRIERLLLDRQFAAVAILRHLHERPFTSVVALPKRGARLRALLTGRAGYKTAYTMASAEDGEITFPLWVSCHRAAGRRGKHGLEHLAFAVLGRTDCPRSVPQVAAEYRARFGIESSYRQMHQVRVRTTSADPALRLLLVGVALLLVNLWVWLKAHLLARTPRADRRAARAWLEDAFRLDRFRDLLIEAIKALYRVHTALAYPFPFTTPLKL